MIESIGFAGHRVSYFTSMTQDEPWQAKWQEAIDFLGTNHRKPFKFVSEERNYTFVKEM